MSGGSDQYESEQALHAGYEDAGPTQGTAQLNIPRETIMAQSESGPSGYASTAFAGPTVPGQVVPQVELARRQGYPNITGRSSAKQAKGRGSIDVSGGVSSLQPNVDYMNSKMKGADPTKLHALITRFHGDFDFKKFIDDISYQGFNRHVFISSALGRITVSQFSRLALLGAIRGSNFNKVKENSLQIDPDLLQLFNDQIIVKNPKRKEDISILRCTASIPQWCAFYMMGAGVPPKVVDSSLPPYLQFPAAASLPMSADLRRQHIEFSIKFSQLIGGAFNPNIYLAAFNNQLPMTEIPDSLRLKLGVQSSAESIGVGAQTMITDLSTQLIKR